MFGVITIACLVVLLLTGVFLMVYFEPSSELVEYRGSYVPLQDLTVSAAFDSTMRLSFEVRGGLLIRQSHHWAALILPASIALQMLSRFFTGDFGKRRRLSWVLLFILFVLVLAAGWTGTALPDDSLSGTASRIMHGIMLGIPVIGSGLASLVYGGEFPGVIIERLYLVHVLVVPVAIAGTVALWARLGYKQQRPQRAGAGRTADNVVGLPFWPAIATRLGGLFLITIGIVFLMAATIRVNPVWLYGPFSPTSASAGSQPPWHLGFLDGALRLVPPGWEVTWLDRTWTIALIVPLVAVSLFLALLVAYPFVEGWILQDRSEHTLLSRPRNTPTRTGIGVAGIVFYGVLWAAAGADVIATQFHLSFEAILLFLRAALVLGPVAAFVLTRAICNGLRAQDVQVVLHGRETGQVMRTLSGGYVELHQDLDVLERIRVTPPPEADHHALGSGSDRPTSRKERLRTRMARKF